jgi:glutathione S-transferase
MKLYYQTHSPYARKVLIFAHEAGIASQLEVIHHETSPMKRNAEVYARNPLGKVPVLLLPGHLPLFDSFVICEYLDTLHCDRRLIPPHGERRWRALRVQAMAQDMADIGISVRWEDLRRPAELRYSALSDGLSQKLVECYDWLERELHVDADVDIAHIALASTLSWIEFRGLIGFRVQRPRLTAWFDKFCQRPSMKATVLSGKTQD